jgi:hypothetical protein
VHAPNGHLAPTLSQSLKKRQRKYEWFLVHPPWLALLSPAPCAVCPFLESGHQPPEITPDTRFSLCIRPLHLSFAPPQPFTVRVGETLSNLRARVARKLGVAAVQLLLSGGPLPQLGTVQSTSLTTSHLMYYEVRRFMVLDAFAAEPEPPVVIALKRACHMAPVNHDAGYYSRFIGASH